MSRTILQQAAFLPRIASFTGALALAVSLVTLVGCAPSAQSSQGLSANTLAASSSTPSSVSAPGSYKTISADEAIQMMKDESGYLIVDVREPDEFASGHIPDAINVPLGTIEGTEVAEMPDKDQLIMLYCRSGRRSALAGAALADMGYTNVIDFGGVLSWPNELVTD